MARSCRSFTRTPTSFASHLFQPENTRGANAFSPEPYQDVVQVDTREFASQEASEFAPILMGAGCAFPNANDSYKPPKDPFNIIQDQPASPSEEPEQSQGFAPCKQLTSFGNVPSSDEVGERRTMERENTKRRSWMGTETETKNKAPRYTGEHFSMFIRAVPVSLFSTQAIIDHFERLPVTVASVSLRGSKRSNSIRTAVVSFESSQEASLANSNCGTFNGTLLNMEFYEPYEVRKRARIKKREEAKRREAENSKLILFQVPHGIGSAKELRQMLDGIGDGVFVELSQYRGAEGTQRIAVITMWDVAAAEKLMKSELEYKNMYLLVQVQAGDFVFPTGKI